MAESEKPGKIARIASLLILAALLFAPFVANLSAAPDAPYGPWADKVIIFKMNDQDKAQSLIESGGMDAWIFWISKKTTLDAISTSAKAALLKVSSSYDDLLLNPVKTRVGFNPFNITGVREALNWIIDREYMAKEIVQIGATPRWTVFRPVAPDYVRNIAFMKDLESKYAYDLEKGKEAIATALTKAGAKFVAGKWQYNNTPIVLKFLIRVGDERQPMGDYIASQLEKVGFTVERRYGTSADASRLVWQADPREGTFNLYTGGWIGTAITAYDDGDPEYFFNTQFSTGRIFNYWSQPKAFGDQLRLLANASYTSAAERNKMVQQAAEACLKNSLRLFLIELNCYWPMTSNFEVVPYDLYGALMWRYTLAGMKVKGQTTAGGTIKIGNRYVLEGDAFNPTAGTNWMYDRVALDPVYDPGIWFDPHTGRSVGYRMAFKVNTAGPKGKVDVPADAIIFSKEKDTYVQVAAGTKATSKVTFNMNFGKWHDGAPITMADVMSATAMVFETTYEQSPVYDPDAAVSSTIVTFVQSLKGLKILNSTAIDVYIDYWHVDETFIAYQAGAPIWTPQPWQIDVITKEAVKNKEVAFGLSNANEWGVEWLDLARGPSLAILKKYFDDFKAKNFIPDNLKTWVTAESAKQGYEAIGNWYAKYGHFLISNGPFMLTKLDSTALQIELSAFREYPIKADFWAKYASPVTPDIRVTGPEEVERRSEATFTITSTYGGQPYAAVEVTAMLLSAAGKPIGYPTVTAGTAGKFTIKYSANDTAKILPGAYTLRVIGTSQEAAIPVVKDLTFTVIAELSYFDREIKRIDADLASKYAATSGQISTINTKLDQINSALGNINIALIVGALGVLLGAASIFLSTRKS